MRQRLRCFWALLLLAGCVTARPRVDATPPTTIVVVRHAEKATAPKEDPPLSPAGAARAQLLVEVLEAMSVTAVLSTDTARTRSTAAPLAARLGLELQLVEARAPDHPQLVAAGVLARHRGETVVVVGHSNTVPEIVAALGAPKPAAICDGGFDDLFVVRVPASGAATVERRKYGAATPCPP